MIEEVIIAGSGGQGILVLGEILAIAGLRNGKHVAWIPEYGPATRGGTANCTVIISDEPIGSTMVDTPSCIIVMNQPSLQKFLPKLKKSGVLISNSSFCSVQSEQSDVDVLEIDANTIAQGIGDIRAANLVMLGAYIAYRNILPTEKILRALTEWSHTNQKEGFLEINRKAIRAGIRLARKGLQNPS